MHLHTASFAITSHVQFKHQALGWANKFDTCCFLDSHHYSDKHHSYECLLAAGAAEIFSPQKNILQQLKNFCNTQKGWVFGHISYDLKNEIENLSSSNPDHIQFPGIFLFTPLIIAEVGKTSVTISCLQDEPAKIFSEIQSFREIANEWEKNILIQPRIAKEKYIQTIQDLKKHILRGDCYEINFCQEFFAEDANIQPLEIYRQLVNISPTPFSCFYKHDEKYLLCASPERYFKKTGNKIISQPIKGTLKRNTNDETIDEALKEELLNSEKERSENVMVVDLVRNDLSKVCKEGGVYVDELFGVYSFPQVHQLISTIVGELKDDIDLSEILCATFPMGSMTGAPKRKVMQLIEKYEQTKRGIFSGAVGYINPQKDFDFNVVIRSILYNAANKYLSYLTGSAITFHSDAEKEYEECLLKAKAIEKVLK